MEELAEINFIATIEGQEGEPSLVKIVSPSHLSYQSANTAPNANEPRCGFCLLLNAHYHVTRSSPTFSNRDLPGSTSLPLETLLLLNMYNDA